MAQLIDINGHLKCQNHYDKIKRKALLAPNTLPADVSGGFVAPPPVQSDHLDRHQPRYRGATGGLSTSTTGGVDIGAVVGGMEASGVYPDTLSDSITFVANAYITRSSARPFVEAG